MTYLRNLYAALESGWRAGIKQYRSMRIKQRNRVAMQDGEF